MPNMLNRHWTEITGHERGRAPTVVLISVEDPIEGGFEMTAYDSNGDETVCVWFAGREASRQWAETEYGEGDVGPWREIPDTVRDLATYAIRQVRR
jgi:hypothetical protein